MHPAFSVIFFTVSAGAGYGLFMLLVLAQVFGVAEVNTGVALGAGITGLILITAGLISSVGHLANPKNAWRAFFRFRTSWLSREGVFAVLFYPFAFFYLVGMYVTEGESNGLITLLGVASLVVALLTLFSQSMIYACLKTIRQWNTALTPANFLLMSLASGAVLFSLVLALSNKPVELVAGLATLFLALAGIMKAVYYFWMKRNTGGSTINTATGFTRAQVRLLDTGHTANTFLTDEFGYRVPADTLKLLKLSVFGLGFILPALLTASMAAFGLDSGFTAILAVIFCLVGIGVERWLFFAEARHVVNLYHGDQRT